MACEEQPLLNSWCPIPWLGSPSPSRGLPPPPAPSTCSAQLRGSAHTLGVQQSHRGHGPALASWSFLSKVSRTKASRARRCWRKDLLIQNVKSFSLARVAMICKEFFHPWLETMLQNRKIWRERNRFLCYVQYIDISSFPCIFFFFLDKL